MGNSRFSKGNKMKRINDPRGTSRRINKFTFEDEPFVFHSKKYKKKMTKKDAKEFADKVTEELLKETR